MADQDNTNTNSYDPMQDTPRHQKTGDPTVDVLYDILYELQNDRGGRFKRAPQESQSSVSSDNKWRFERPEREEQYRSRGNLLDDFEEGIKDQLLDSLAHGSFKKGIQGALATFQQEFGFDLRNAGHEAGKAITKTVLKHFGDSKLGQNLKKGAADLGNSLLNRAFKNDAAGNAAKDGIKNVIGSFFGSAQGGGAQGANMAGQALSTVAKNPQLQSLATKGLAKGAVSLGPWGLLIIGIVYTIVKVLGPALKGLGEMAKALGKSFNREEELRKKRLENAQKRLKEDVDYLTEEPFKILQQAVEKWTSTWDANLRNIGQIQGYDKEAVYSLYESYAERLRKDNLDSVINATDIVDKLASVLDSGLSGIAAEEFSYVATKLGAAIPNQDFFGYADTYASIAANAISQGKTQAEALSIANQQLEQFASNLLFSSRELAGGFTTSLKNGSSLFKDAVQIAQTAKTYNADAISGTLTSVSAIIGAVAPDMADSIVSNIVQAAIGGNSSQIVALRSLAGINAGNTEFLKSFAENPQEVFSKLFTNLAQMQNMSPDNYMEVAEGLAEVFGIDKNAFARVDFNYLAQAVDAMEVNYNSLNDNLKLLASGQTTTSAEQLKAQEINRVILDEGLAYVIDSEAGRMIQEHMWDEQRDNAMMNATYAVDLQGSALSFLEGIRKTVTTLLNFLNPVGFIAKGVANMTATIAEAVGNENDIKEVLKLGAVGGNTESFYNLTTRGKDLKLTTSLVEMMGGTKGVAALNQLVDVQRKIGNYGSMITMGLLTGIPSSSADMFNTAWDGLSSSRKGPGGLDIAEKTSQYSWGSVGKAIVKALQSTPINSNVIGSVVRDTINATQNAQDSSNKKFQEFLDTAEEASKTMSYEWWVKTAKDYGISDFSEALKTYGRTEEEIRSYFEANQAQEGARQEIARKEDEQLFRDQAREYWDENRAFWEDTKAYWDENRLFWDFAGGNGIFRSSIWNPFFGDGQKYDTRMTKVDTALSNIQMRIGSSESHTVISGIEELSRKLGDDAQFSVLGILGEMRNDLSTTFVSSSSRFQKCLADWIRYIASKEVYTTDVIKSTAWNDLKSAEQDEQMQTNLALAKALEVFSADELKKLDPQLQTNVLLGEIVVILQTIMQQNNSSANGMGMIDSLSAMAMGLGLTK